jgi:hypothetical protein
MLPDLLQAHNPPRPVLLHIERRNRSSPNLVGRRVLHIPRIPLHPPDERLLDPLPGRQRYLEARCLQCRELGRGRDMCWGCCEIDSNAVSFCILFSLVFLPFFPILLIPSISAVSLSPLPGEAATGMAVLQVVYTSLGMRFHSTCHFPLGWACITISLHLFVFSKIPQK